jgi:predicted nucleic acid-binding protein
MYLIDSSAWIEYLRPDGSRKAKELVSEILRKDEAVTCGIVVVEVLRGAKNDKDYDALKDAMLSLPQIPIDSRVVERAAKWGFAIGRKGRTVPTTDLFIAACAHKTAAVLHSDMDFETIRSVAEFEEKKV